MTYSGHVKNGQIVLDEPAQHPDGASVNIEVVEPVDESTFSARDLLRVPVERRREILKKTGRTRRFSL